MNKDGVLLQATGLGRDYARRQEIIRALEDVDLEVRRGEQLVVTGPSGAGKTTLLQLLAGLDRPTRGDVVFEGQSYRGLGERERARLRAHHMGFVFQDFGIVRGLTALENVELMQRLAGQAPDRTAALGLLEQMGLGPRSSHLAHELSRGELQRVAVARALVHRPSVLFADEPTGSLDAESARTIARIFDELRERSDLSVLLVTHNPEWTRHADRVLELRDGRWA